MLHILASAIHREELKLPFQLPEEFVNNHQCVAVLSGGAEVLFLKLYDEGKVSLNEPIYIIASGYSNSLAASLEILTWIQQHKGTGRVITSPEQINNLEYGTNGINGNNLPSAYSVDSALKRTDMRVGVIGEPSDWLIASHVEDADALKFGVELVHIPIEEVSSLGEVDGGMKGAELIYERLKEIIKRYKLDALTLRCFDLLTTVKNTGCIALSHLNDEGIPASCEGDLPLLFTMLYAKQFYGQIGFQVNPARVQSDGKILFAHCTIPLKMTTSHVYDTHFESGIGVGIHGELPLGKYRLLKLSPDLTELVDEPVELIANQYEPNLCRTQVWIQTTPEVANELLTHPKANHHLLIRDND